MWNEIYSWNVQDAVKEGKALYAVTLDGELPVLLDVAKMNVETFFRLREMDKAVCWFVKKEENDGDTDGTDE